jgi:hypothetical protein
MDTALQAAIATAAIALDTMGFKRAGDEFVRSRPEFVDCVAFQRRSDNAAFAVNVGVQPICVLDTGKRDAAALLALREVDCYVRERLLPDGQTDYWWPTVGNAVAVAKEVDSVLRTKGDSFFADFASIEGSILPISVEDIAEGRTSSHFAKLTRTRLALLVAKANMEARRFGAAKELAEYGLKIAGMAVGPKKEFKTILSQLEGQPL